MNLKEAFRFQNKLVHLTDLASNALSTPGSIVRTQITYLRKKAMPEAEDEVVTSESSAFYAGRDKLAGAALSAPPRTARARTPCLSVCRQALTAQKL